MNNRKTIQVLRVWFRWYDIIVIWYEFCVHAGFFRDCHDVFQPSILVDAECDCDFVVGIIGDNGLQIVDIPDDVDITVRFAVLFPVIQYAMNDITPFRVGTDTVNVTFGGTAIANEKDVFQIVALFPEFSQNSSDHKPENEFKNKIDAHEYNDKKAGVVTAFYKIKSCSAVKNAAHVCLEQVVHLGFSACHTLGVI